jgi:hypothetical protein
MNANAGLTHHFERRPDFFFIPSLKKPRRYYGK